jgi:hypothetical protein
MRLPIVPTAALIALLAGVSGCGGRNVSKKTAQEIIAGQFRFKEKAVDVESVSQVTPGEAIIQTRVPAAFLVEKVRGHWQIREVRIGNGPWEKLDNILAALDRVKVEETRNMLSRVADALEAYRRKNGRIPDFRDYVSLSDALSPEFLQPLVRDDAWRRPLNAARTAPDAVTLSSSGPDGIAGNDDDVVLTYRPK